jgi:hypothetical protein
MGVIVAFNYANWIALYPEFAAIPQATVEQQYFPLATAYHRNDGGGPVRTAALQSVYLNMMTAHIAARYGTIGGQAPSTLVGRISNASEGSVSVGTDFPLEAPSQAWFAQTKYGADYWQATKAYRTMRYRVAWRAAVAQSPYNGLYGSRLAGIGY